MPRSLQKRTHSHYPSTSQVEVQTSLGQSIKQGFGFGVGSHLANAILGPASRQNPSEYKPTEYKPTEYKPTEYKPTESKPTGSKPTEYKQCMIEHNDKAACAYLLEKD